MNINVKNCTFFLITAVCCGLLSSPSFPAAMVSGGNFNLPTNVIAGTGTLEQSSGGYKLLNVGAQLTCGTAESAAGIMKSGGLYTLIATYTKGAGQRIQSFTITSRPKNVPNPFRPGHNEGTTIVYNLPSNTDVKLIIYDITGRAVWQRSFRGGENGGKATDNRVFWDGRDDFGRTVANGAYIYIITSGKKILAKGQMAVMD